MLSDRDRDWLATTGDRTRLAVGESNIREGTCFDRLDLLLSGELEVTISKSGGAAESVGRVSPGQLVGEISFVTDLLPIATLTATQPTEILSLDRQTLARKLSSDAEFAARFYMLVCRTLAQRVRQNTELIATSELIPVPPLRKVLLMFAIFEDGDLGWMLSHGRQQKLAPNSVLIAEGQATDMLYISIDGVLSVSVQIPGQAEPKVVASLESGEFLGEISFVESGLASATVSCVEPSLVFALPRPALVEHIEADRGFAARFYNAIAIVMADRLQDRLLQRGYGLVAYGDTESLDDDIEYADELDMETLEKTAIAGSRFDWFLKQAKSAR